MNKKIGILLMILTLLLTSAFDLVYTPEENNDPEITYTDPAGGEIPSDTGSGEAWTPENPEPVYIGEDQPPADQPPADQPSYDQPPADQPPADQPAYDQPPADQPSYDQPPVDQPPADQPPADQPPAEVPPTEVPTPVPPQWIDIDEDQVGILYNIYSQMTNTGRAYSGWFIDGNYEPCTWQGISCEYNRVTGLNFQNTGYFTTFPDQILSLRDLKELRMTDTLMYGPLPKSLFRDLPKLEKLELRGNFLTGNIPPLPDYFEAGPMLQSIKISDNLQDDRKSQLLWRGEYADTTSFQLDPWAYPNIDLTPGLDGTIPDDWNRLSSLSKIDLSGNSLSGSVPETFWQLWLTELDLSNNAGWLSISRELYDNWASQGNPNINLNGLQPPAPTEVPTEVPTEIPTEVPTEIPTEVPTEVPTEIPTEVPTEIPTEIPTEVPTEVPTQIPPTEIPPQQPPTQAPAVPTAVPTQVPPTAVPAQQQPNNPPQPQPNNPPQPQPNNPPQPQPNNPPQPQPNNPPQQQPNNPPQQPPTQAPAVPTAVPTQVPPTAVPAQQQPNNQPQQQPNNPPQQQPTQIVIVVTATPVPQWYTATPQGWNPQQGRPQGGDPRPNNPPQPRPQPYYYPQQNNPQQYYYPQQQPYYQPQYTYPTATPYQYTNPSWVYPTATSAYTYPQIAATAAPAADASSMLGFTYTMTEMTENNIPMTWRNTGMAQYSINYLDVNGDLYPAFAMEWTSADELCNESVCNASVSNIPDALLQGGTFSLQLRAQDQSGKTIVSDPVMMQVSIPEPVPTPTPVPEESHSFLGGFFRWLFSPFIRLFGGK